MNINVHGVSNMQEGCTGVSVLLRRTGIAKGSSDITLLL